VQKSQKMLHFVVSSQLNLTSCLLERNLEYNRLARELVRRLTLWGLKYFLNWLSIFDLLGCKFLNLSYVCQLNCLIGNYRVKVRSKTNCTYL